MLGSGEGLGLLRSGEGLGLAVLASCTVSCGPFRLRSRGVGGERRALTVIQGGLKPFSYIISYHIISYQYRVARETTHHANAPTHPVGPTCYCYLTFTSRNIR